MPTPLEHQREKERKKLMQRNRRIKAEIEQMLRDEAYYRKLNPAYTHDINADGELTRQMEILDYAYAQLRSGLAPDVFAKANAASGGKPIERRTRTWPYGTTKPVLVLSRDLADHHGERVEVLAVKEIKDAPGPCEAHILIQKPTEIGWPGDRGVVTFTEGGPTGGHWVFTLTKTAAEIAAEATCVES